MAEFDRSLELKDLKIGDILYEPSAIDKDAWQNSYTLALIKSVKSISRPTIPQIIIDYVKYSGTDKNGTPQFYVPNENEINITIDNEELIELLHLFTFQTPILYDKKIRKNVKSIVGISPTMVLLFPLPFYWKW